MEGHPCPHIFVENDKIIIVVNKQIVIINKENILNYIVKSTFDLTEIISILIKCIKMNKYVIKIIRTINITCILEGILQNDTLTVSIPRLLLRDPDTNNRTEQFTIYKVNNDIMFKNNKKYTKYIANISTLYDFIKSDIKYPIELFKKIVHTSIENETAINRIITQDDVNYIISYSWDGLISGSFDLVIPIINFKFDKSKIVSDVENIPQANIIINRMNAILAEYTEEKELIQLEDVDRELVRFSNCLNIITQFDTIFHKLGRLYPHLSIIDCKELTKKYINCDYLTVHSGEYIEMQINNGFGYMRQSSSANTGGNWYYMHTHIKIWNCCGCLTIQGYSEYRDGSGISLRLYNELYDNILIKHTNMKNVNNICIIPCSTFIYTDIIELIRNKRIFPYYYRNLKIINRYNTNTGKKVIDSDQLTKFIEGYGLPRPDTYCLTARPLVL